MRCPPIPIDSGTGAEAQSVMPSIALPCELTQQIFTTAAPPLGSVQIAYLPPRSPDRVARLSLLSEVSAVGRHMMGSEG